MLKALLERMQGAGGDVSLADGEQEKSAAADVRTLSLVSTMKARVGILRM